jgi:hypothetical protein
MNQFSAWTSILASHASDADDRKPYTVGESPKHYIDIDNFSDFNQSGRIPQTLDSVIAKYGYSFVYAQGVLPWATQTSFDSLKNCFLRKDWEKAVLFAADLGHYVADGHMPMHITRNYNGQYTGNDGIHSRYESTMINAFINEIIYSGKDIDTIANVNEYIFQYIYHNYSYVDSVLAADDSAKAVNSNYYSTDYKQTLWNLSKEYTILLFKEASHAITELIYTAWVQAGSPGMNDTGIKIPQLENTIKIEQNAPNPFSDYTRIRYFLPQGEKVLLEIRDLRGKKIATLVDENKSYGQHEIYWQIQNEPDGIYYLILSTGNKRQTIKMLLSK